MGAVSPGARQEGEKIGKYLPFRKERAKVACPGRCIWW